MAVGYDVLHWYISVLSELMCAVINPFEATTIPEGTMNRPANVALSDG